MKKEISKTINNTAMLYLMIAGKLIFPLLTLPYLTRILSEPAYGVVSYVKSCMIYMQLLVDFGFLQSTVKDIVRAKNGEEIGLIAGHTFVAKFILVLFAAAATLIMTLCIKGLRDNTVYTALSFVSVAVSVLLADFLFRGIEKMHIVSLVYVVMKGTATALTFVFVRGDGDLLWIPALDIIGTACAVVITWIVIFKLKIKVRFCSLKRSFSMLKESFGYFISDIATTAFGALNTIMIGIFITDMAQVAHWSVCMQIMSAIQTLYTPINQGVYPQMVRGKSLGLIHKVMLIFMPIVIVGCAICFIFAKFALTIVGGEKYAEAYVVFRCLIPVLLFSFPGMLYGWPALGAIDKVKQTSMTTIVTAVVQVAGLLFLAVIGKFTLVNLAILRSATELLMMVLRISLTYRYKKCFNISDANIKEEKE